MAQQLCGIQLLLKEPGLSEWRLLIRAGIIFVLYKQQHNPLILWILEHNWCQGKGFFSLKIEVLHAHPSQMVWWFKITPPIEISSENGL